MYNNTVSYMQPFLDLGSRRIIKVGGSYCIPIPSYALKNINAGKGTKLNMELMDDKSIRIKPN